MTSSTEHPRDGIPGASHLDFFLFSLTFYLSLPGHRVDSIFNFEGHLIVISYKSPCSACWPRLMGASALIEIRMDSSSLIRAFSVHRILKRKGLADLLVNIKIISNKSKRNNEKNAEIHKWCKRKALCFTSSLNTFFCWMGPAPNDTNLKPPTVGM